MNEKQRILNLLKEGRITSEEAVMLLEAIEEPVSAPRGNPNWGGELSRMTREMSRELSREAAEISREIGRAFKGDHPVPPVPPVPPMAPNPPVVVVYGNEVNRPEGLQWVRVKLNSGDLSVSLNPDLERPHIEGDVNVRDLDGTIFVENNHGSVRRKGSKKFAGITVSWDVEFSEGEDPTIHLPIGWGLECEIMSGDVNIEGLPFVRGRILSGDVHLEDIHGLQLRVDSGDIYAENLTLREGSHSLEVLSGDVNLNFVNSSVSIEGKMTSGDLDAPENFVLEGQRFEGRIGEGQAELKIKVSSGDVRIETV